MRTSYSALETFKQCPLKYKYGEIDRIKAPKSKEAVFGSLIHETLRFLHGQQAPHPSLDQILNFYRDRWNSEIYGNKDEEAIIFSQGARMLRDYYQNNHPSKFHIIDLETRFEAPMGEHILAGKIDRIDKLEDGNLEIIDYKTARQMPSQSMVDSDLQLSIYAIGLKQRWPNLSAFAENHRRKPMDECEARTLRSSKSEGGCFGGFRRRNEGYHGRKPVEASSFQKEIKLSLYFLKHGIKLSSQRTNQELENTKQRVLDIIQEINKNDFKPIPSPLCGWCGYQKICPMWRHKYQKSEITNHKSQPFDFTQVAPNSIEGQNEIEKIIKEYLGLIQQNRNNNKRLAELKNIVNNFCDNERVERIFCDDGYITRLPQQRFGYDFDLVCKILQPLGKWDRVLVIDKTKLKKVLAEIPEHIRRQIQEARKIEKEFKVLKIKIEKKQKENHQNESIIHTDLHK